MATHQGANRSARLSGDPRRSDEREPVEAKVDLMGPDGTPRLVWVVGIGRADLRRLLSEVRDRQAELLAAWRRVHG